MTNGQTDFVWGNIAFGIMDVYLNDVAAGTGTSTPCLVPEEPIEYCHRLSANKKLLYISNDSHPTAGCRSVVVAQIDPEGHLSLSPTDLNSGSSDDHTPAKDLVFTLEFPEGPPGCHNVYRSEQPTTLVVTDNLGQSSRCTSLVAVEDTLPPVLKCRNTVIVLDIETGKNVFDPIEDDAISFRSDNCGISREVDFTGPFVYDCTMVGDHKVRISQDDVHGNRSSCNVIVTVIDPWLACDQYPVARCQPVVITQVDADGRLAIDPASFDDGSTDDNTPPEDLVFSLEFDNGHPACNDAHLPIQTVSLIVTDSVGQPSSCTSRLIVEDTIAPVLLCQDVTVGLDYPEEKISFDPIEDAAIVSGYDNCELAAGVDLNGSHSYTCAELGDNYLQIIQKDVNGNVATCDVVVTVIDPGNTCQALPVKWLSFGATAGAETVELQWEISTTSDNDGFYVERLAGHNEWSVIGLLDASSGSDRRYCFTDISPFNGISSYRLRQTTFDGLVSYSRVETVGFNFNDRVAASLNLISRKT